MIDWLSQCSAEFREGVELVAIDPTVVYAAAIRTPGLFSSFHFQWGMSGRTAGIEVLPAQWFGDEETPD
ncbi:hypothetical protein [Mycolicibacillus koreensis]|uniref:Uncharacterized protein n=1 Tax=Mycolicibacillus koreensis TaxID=1069220 RepID=A0A7I7SI97_9MYCO|nr:hypothetical protein [Mycolicibacillus koreensis]ODR06296.1 hypothetical protein BHQ15_13390 [Mycolicibacillus koreensis]OSC33665.1 hypothetical protein B8W67_09810 [Mycolicibacillus koreensis]BBY56230.1 hypothetical protein MKOR_34810 [Mycolicibacillus koreensis]